MGNNLGYNENQMKYLDENIDTAIRTIFYAIKNGKENENWCWKLFTPPDFPFSGKQADYGRERAIEAGVPENCVERIAFIASSTNVGALGMPHDYGE